MARVKCLYLVRAGDVLKSLGEWPQAYAPNYIVFLLIYLFILAALGLHCCAWAFFSCGEPGLLLDAVCGLLIVVASRCRTWALGAWASVVVARRL